MPLPRVCPNPQCPNHRSPARRWWRPYGSYPTRAHGAVRRVRCRHCGATASTQTESLHYFAKRRLPLSAVWLSLLGGASQRDIARRYGVSPMAVQGAVLRLGRQAMAAQLQLLAALCPRSRLVFDGLRSCVTSGDFPCDITTVVEPKGETVLTMTHTVFRRGGTRTPAQRRRSAAKYARWRPQAGTMKRDISQLLTELWDYLRPAVGAPATVDTDEQPLYRALIAEDPRAAHFRLARLLRHRRTPGSAPRTRANPLFAVNYLDRLLRHRLREHTRESFAIGRHAVMQMHRAWIFAWDHNAFRLHRVRRPLGGVHATQSAVQAAFLTHCSAEFFTRRIRPRGVGVPQTVRRVWLGELPTPPLRWRRGQTGTTVVVPRYAQRELEAAAMQQAA